MIIGLNGQRLLIDNPAGPEKYTHNIYNGLAKIDKVNKYIIYFSEAPSEDYFKKLTEENNNFSFKTLSSKFSWTQKSLSNQLFKDKLDIFFTPVHTLPIFRPKKTKYITMVHGLEFNHIVLKNPIRKFLLGKPEKYVCKNSDLLIVPSTGTKDVILRKGWSRNKNIHVVPEGVGSEFYKRSQEEVSNVKKKYKISVPEYFLFVGTVHPRKNLPATVEAFALAINQLNRKKEAGDKVNLAIAGKLGWNYEESLNASKKYCVENEVLYLGRVADADLPALITGATALVNISLEEGFGLPLLEAMACETPCLVSDIPSFKEVCGEYATYVDPRKLEEISDGFIKLLNFRDSELVSKAKERAKKFTWEESAKKTLDVFESVIKNS